MNKLLAIRSLTSSHHAENIVPKIINISWTLGKRCNYDCEYCHHTVHDWISPHMPLDKIKNFLAKADAWAIEHQKSIKWSIGGGEPYMHPDILEILASIKKTHSCDSILHIISNGSYPLELYQNSLDSVTNLSLSLHFYRPEKEIRRIADKIITLHQNNPDKFIHVQVMMLPGKFKFIQEIIEQFNQAGVKQVFRRIKPMPKELEELQYKDTTRREFLKKTIDIVDHRSQRKEYKTHLVEGLEDVYHSEDYYSTEELAWLKENIPEVRWQNIGVWHDDDQYTETNSDELVLKDLHSFKGWTCYVGVDNAYIDHTGDIYRGACRAQGLIGTFDNFTGFAIEPLTCEFNWCTSNHDQNVRKALPGNEHYITK